MIQSKFLFGSMQLSLIQMLCMNFINIHHGIYKIWSLEKRTPMKNSKSEKAKNLKNINLNWFNPKFLSAVCSDNHNKGCVKVWMKSVEPFLRKVWKIRTPTTTTIRTRNRAASQLKIIYSLPLKPDFFPSLKILKIYATFNRLSIYFIKDKKNKFGRRREPLPGVSREQGSCDANICTLDLWKSSKNLKLRKLYFIVIQSKLYFLQHIANIHINVLFELQKYSS